jgi:energy-converting hydrogenase Eha subunit B
MIGAGVALFTVAVATGGFDAQLGNILGNSLAVSRGYARIIGPAAAVLFLILAMPLSKAMVDVLVPDLLAGGVRIPSILP